MTHPPPPSQAQNRLDVPLGLGTAMASALPPSMSGNGILGHGHFYLSGRQPGNPPKLFRSRQTPPVQVISKLNRDLISTMGAGNPKAWAFP